MVVFVAGHLHTRTIQQFFGTNPWQNPLWFCRDFGNTKDASTGALRNIRGSGLEAVMSRNRMSNFVTTHAQRFVSSLK